MESPSDRCGAQPAWGPRAVTAAVLGRSVALAALASFTACDAILGIPGHLETAEGTGGAGTTSGSSGAGGDGSVVLRESRVAAMHQAESTDSATKVTLHVVELGQRVCNPSGSVCIQGGLLTQGTKP